MGSKPMILFGLFLATVLLIHAEVAARELAETTSNTVDTSKVVGKTNEVAVNDAKYGRGSGGYPGRGYGGNPGGGYGGGYPGRSYGGGGGGGYCRYGCCGQNYYGSSCRCCTYAKPQN